MSSENYHQEKKDNEYHYTDENITQDHLAADAHEATIQKRNIVAKLLNRKVIIVLVILIAILVVYKLVTPTIKPAEETNLSQQSMSDTSTAPATVSPSLATVDNGAQQQVDLLTQQTKQDQTQINDLQANIQRLNNAVVQLQNSFASVNDAVQNLTDKVQKLSDTQKTVPVKKEKSKVATVGYKPVVYYLKAVVPGRAWLQGSNGKLLTVKLGDTLQGYGTVQSIDATQGWVGMSSGTVIQYGPDDS